MKQRVLVGLSSFAFWLPGLLRTLDSQKRTLGFFFILYILLSCFLFAGHRTALRIYRFLLWLTLILSLGITLLAMSGERTMLSMFQKITRSASIGEAWIYSIVWIIYLGAVLYYSEKDNVRAAYGLEPKNSGKKDDPNTEHTIP